MAKLKQWYLKSLKILEISDLSLVDWADKYRNLSPESSSEIGRWNTSRTPYMKEPMEVISDKQNEQVVIMASAQVGKTELILNLIGYCIHQDPSPIMVVLPTEELANAFSEDRLATMIRDTEVLRNKVFEFKSRNASNTKLHKSFEGGHVTIIGANAPAPLSSRPVKILLCDEIDRYPVSAGKEGDPVTIVEKRSTTYFDRKIIKVSTPTLKNASKIEELYNEGSKAVWELPCPNCGEYQELAFEFLDLETSEMYCKHCGCYDNEFEWKKNSDKGKWNHKHPEAEIKSYNLNAFASPWVYWSNIAKEFIKSKKAGDSQLQVFYNTVLGLPFEIKGDVGNPQKLYELRENYTKVPNEVKVLTCGIDTQDNRLEYEIVGWAEDDESWGIQKGFIIGNPSIKRVWGDLYNILNSEYEKEDGSKIIISMSFIDSGGHYTDKVYDFARVTKRVYAIKGRNMINEGLIHPNPTFIKNYGIHLILLGVNNGKEQILQMCDPESTIFKSHFPLAEEFNYTLEYFNQLFSEKRVLRTVNGSAQYVWESIRKRNEALDCRVYAYCALKFILPRWDNYKSIFTKQENKVKTNNVVKRRRKRNIWEM